MLGAADNFPVTLPSVYVLARTLVKRVTASFSRRGRLQVRKEVENINLSWGTHGGELAVSFLISHCDRWKPRRKGWKSPTLPDSTYACAAHFSLDVQKREKKREKCSVLIKTILFVRNSLVTSSSSNKRISFSEKWRPLEPTKTFNISSKEINAQIKNEK